MDELSDELQELAGKEADHALRQSRLLPESSPEERVAWLRAVAICVEERARELEEDLVEEEDDEDDGDDDVGR